MTDKSRKMHGELVSEEEVSNALGFKDVDDFRAWQAAGSPTGRCSNPHCYRPILWHETNEPVCKVCKSPVNLDKPGGENF